MTLPVLFSKYGAKLFVRDTHTEVDRVIRQSSIGTDSDRQDRGKTQGSRQFKSPLNYTTAVPR